MHPIAWRNVIQCAARRWQEAIEESCHCTGAGITDVVDRHQAALDRAGRETDTVFKLSGLAWPQQRARASGR